MYLSAPSARCVLFPQRDARFWPITCVPFSKEQASLRLSSMPSFALDGREGFFTPQCSLPNFVFFSFKMRFGGSVISHFARATAPFPWRNAGVRPLPDSSAPPRRVPGTGARFPDREMSGRRTYSAFLFAAAPLVFFVNPTFFRSSDGAAPSTAFPPFFFLRPGGLPKKQLFPPAFRKTCGEFTTLTLVLFFHPAPLLF